MKKKQKLTAVLLSVLMATGCLTVAAAEPSGEYALVSASSAKISGSGQVRGDALVTGGELSGGYNAWSTGTIFITPDVSVKNASPENKDNIKPFEGSAPSYTFEQYGKTPETTYFVGKQTLFQDGTKDLIVGTGDYPNGFALKTEAFIRNLTVPYDTTLNIDVASGVSIIRVGKLTNNGKIKIRGGKVVLYADEIGSVNNGSFNDGGDPENLTLFFNDYSKNIDLNYAKLSGSIVVPYSNFHMNSSAMAGNIYAGMDVKLDGDNQIKGLVYAPVSATKIAGSSRVYGKLITKMLDLSGSGFIELSGTQQLPGDVGGIIGDQNDSQLSGGGPVQKPEEPTSPAPTEPGSDSTGQPEEPPAGGDSGTQPDQGEVTITAVVARRMSIRLEDGRILKNGDKFNMQKYGTVRFQVCTNNWDSNTYTDDGQGIAGPVVYEYKHQKNKENYLRVDNDRYFMPVRFHFEKGDYNKQTGVDKVLSTPLESLSINFPLGATINVEAYVKNQVAESRNIFVDSSLEWVNWSY